MYVAVYGSLRKGHGNFEYLLKGEEFIGQFETEPIYTLLDLGSFPGLVKAGGTSVVMEVFDVDAEKLKKLDGLEGYYGVAEKKTNHYNREKIDSPFGPVSTYFYNKMKKKEAYRIVPDGDWTDYNKTKQVISL